MKKIKYFIGMLTVLATVGALLFVNLPVRAIENTLLTKDEKIKINIDGVDFYSTMQVNFNELLDDRTGHTVQTNNFTVSYDPTAKDIMATIKRSIINNLIGDGDKTVGSVLLHLDLYDFSNMKYTAEAVSIRSGGEIVKKIDITFPSQAFEGYIEMLGGASDFAGSIIGQSSRQEAYLINDDKLSYSDDLATNGILYINFNKADYNIYKEFNVSVRVVIDEDVIIQTKNIESYSIPPTYPTINGEEAVKNNIDLIYANYDKAQKLKYSWTIRNEDIKNPNIEVSSNINVDDSPNKEKIDSHFKKNDIGDIKYLTFDHHGALPGTATIKIYVGDKFKSGQKVVLYYYNPDLERLEVTEKDISTSKDGYVEFTIDHCSDYVLVKDGVAVSGAQDSIVPSSASYWSIARFIYILVGVIFVVMCIVVAFIIKRKKNAKKSKVMAETTPEAGSVADNEEQQTNLDNIEKE